MQPRRAPLRWPRIALIVIAVAFTAAVLPHALEDFQYGDLLRFGIQLPLGIGILAASLALDVAGIALVLRAHSRGALLLAVIGAVWSIGAIVAHGHDMLFGGPAYRHGFISRLLEASIIVLGGLLATLGFLVARNKMFWVSTRPFP